MRSACPVFRFKTGGTIRIGERILEWRIQGDPMSDTDQLLIPNAAAKDPESFELLRVWIANKGQHVSLRTGVWRDPSAWGILLADLARHVANSYEQEEGLVRLKTLQ